MSSAGIDFAALHACEQAVRCARGVLNRRGVPVLTATAVAELAAEYARRRGFALSLADATAEASEQLRRAYRART